MFIGCVGAYTFRVQVIRENFTRATHSYSKLTRDSFSFTLTNDMPHHTYFTFLPCAFVLRVQYRVGNGGSRIDANDDFSGSSLAVVDLGTRWVRRRVFEITFSVWRDSHVFVFFYPNT